MSNVTCCLLSFPTSPLIPLRTRASLALCCPLTAERPPSSALPREEGQGRILPKQKLQHLAINRLMIWNLSLGTRALEFPYTSSTRPPRKLTPLTPSLCPSTPKGPTATGPLLAQVTHPLFIHL